MRVNERESREQMDDGETSSRLADNDLLDSIYNINLSSFELYLKLMSLSNLPFLSGDLLDVCALIDP